MKTEIVEIEKADSWKVALKDSILNKIPFVIPTETVYGLAALYNDTEMIQNVFKAKSRPQDNPLIVHIGSIEQLQDLISVETDELPENIVRLTDKFWPGPLTILFKKSLNVPDIVTANSEYVGIRMPSHAIAQKLLTEVGTPLVAPSANISGKPSPTNASDVFEDLDGKVELIFDGGECEIGLESTVIKMSDNMKECIILRPGNVTEKDLVNFFDKVEIEKSILEFGLSYEVKPESPGLKYKHYSPKAKVVLIGKLDDLANCDDKNCVILTYSRRLDAKNCIFFESEEKLANKLFSTFRELDRSGVDKIYVEMPEDNMALKNRLIKASI